MVVFGSLAIRVIDGRQPLATLYLSLGESAGSYWPEYGVRRSSPDGAWLAYTAQEFGRYLPWLYVSRLDGSTRILVSRLDGHWNAVSAVWSPDGRWLLLHVQDMESPDAGGVNLAIAPATCQTLFLPRLHGLVKAWAP